MLCERCGKDISDSAAICPSCGTLTSTASAARPAGQPPTQHGPYSTDTYDEPISSYEQGYTPRQDYKQPPQFDYRQPPRSDYAPPPQSNYQYGQSYAPPRFQPGSINVNVYNNYTPPTQKNNGALIAEIILSLFGIFGVGWLISGETTIGVLLLVGSLVLYIPIAILGIVFTLGFGIVCIGPLSIAAIIINAILLNNALNRKAAQQITILQAQQMPPQYPRY